MDGVGDSREECCEYPKGRQGLLGVSSVAEQEYRGDRDDRLHDFPLLDVTAGEILGVSGVAENSRLLQTSLRRLRMPLWNGTWSEMFVPRAPSLKLRDS